MSASAFQNQFLSCNRLPAEIVDQKRPAVNRNIQGRPYRVLYIFDPRRVAILLLGGDKTGDDRWYDKFVPVADRLFQEHLNELKKEGRL